MNISVVVVCFNEEKNIEPCIESLIKQDYPPENMEIIVSDGGSRDKTIEIIEKLALNDKRIKLVIEKKQGTAAGRNAGVKAAQYPFVAFTDADCEVPTDWLKSLAENFIVNKDLNPKLAAVGGGNTSPKDGGKFLEALDIALDSFLGSFTSIQGRKYKKPVFVPSLANLNVLYEKEAIISAGLFDESLLSDAEDAELNFRIRRHGGLFLYVPEISVYHKFRPTLKVWYKNMFRYGRGRARLLRRHPQMWHPFYVLPLLFPPVIISGLLGFFSPWFYLPFLYLPLILLFSIIKCAANKKIQLFWLVFTIFLTTHTAYSLGEYNGLFVYKEGINAGDKGR